MNDWKKTLEGYKDLTAYEAIKNVEGIKVRREEVKRGDIYVAQSMSGRPVDVLVLKTSPNYCTCLTMTIDQEEPSNCVQIKARSSYKLADVARPCYVYYDKLTERIRQMDDKEFGLVVNKLCDIMGYSDFTTSVKEVPVEVVKEVVKEVPAPINVVDTSDHAVELAKAVAERDVYKNLYTSLLTKMMGVAV